MQAFQEVVRPPELMPVLHFMFLTEKKLPNFKTWEAFFMGEGETQSWKWRVYIQCSNGDSARCDQPGMKMANGIVEKGVQIVAMDEENTALQALAESGVTKTTSLGPVETEYHEQIGPCNFLESPCKANTSVAALVRIRALLSAALELLGSF